MVERKQRYGHGRNIILPLLLIVLVLLGAHSILVDGSQHQRYHRCVGLSISGGPKPQPKGPRRGYR